MMAALVFNDLCSLLKKASPMLKCKEMKGNEGRRFSNHYPIERQVYMSLEFISTLCHILHNNVQLADN